MKNVSEKDFQDVDMGKYADEYTEDGFWVKGIAALLCCTVAKLPEKGKGWYICSLGLPYFSYRPYPGFHSDCRLC